MVDFVKLSNKRTNSVRTIRTLSRICSADFQTLFSKFSAESQPAICRDTNDNLYLLIPQYLWHLAKLRDKYYEALRLIYELTEM